jgi:hypothetical protein
MKLINEKAETVSVVLSNDDINQALAAFIREDVVPSSRDGLSLKRRCCRRRVLHRRRVAGIFIDGSPGYHWQAISYRHNLTQ